MGCQATILELVLYIEHLTFVVEDIVLFVEENAQDIQQRFQVQFPDNKVPRGFHCGSLSNFKSSSVCDSTRQATNTDRGQSVGYLWPQDLKSFRKWSQEVGITYDREPYALAKPAPLQVLRQGNGVSVSFDREGDDILVVLYFIQEVRSFAWILVKTRLRTLTLRLSLLNRQKMIVKVNFQQNSTFMWYSEYAYVHESGVLVSRVELVRCIAGSKTMEEPDAGAVCLWHT